jgi:hypothetical protein
VKVLDQNVTLVVSQAEQLLTLLTHLDGRPQDDAMRMCEVKPYTSTFTHQQNCPHTDHFVKLADTLLGTRNSAYGRTAADTHTGLEASDIGKE